ncbi:MAG: hypothetical protein ACREMJ_00975 [Gemmatimonadales bacterium]
MTRSGAGAAGYRADCFASLRGIRFYRKQQGVGRVNIDLLRALANGASRDNVMLQPEDSVETPEYQPSVNVTGAVNAPGSVFWKRGEEPGSEVFVPVKDPNEKGADLVALFGAIAQILASTVAIVVIATRP